MNDTLGSTSPDVRTVDPGRGLAWWTEAWALFTPSAILWSALGLIMIVGYAVVGMVPVVGGLALALATPVFVGSWMLAAQKVQGGGALAVGDLFTCFTGERLTPLVVLGALLVAATVVIGVVAGALGMGAMFGMMAGGAPHGMGSVMTAMGAGMLALLVMLLLVMLASMALWFAPALVVFRGTAPVDALRASFAATLKNIAPFLVWSLIYIVAAIVASIPFGLGWIVLVPVTMLSVYVSYRDVFGGG
jgi:hypothetical protein